MLFCEKFVAFEYPVRSRQDFIGCTSGWAILNVEGRVHYESSAMLRILFCFTLISSGVSKQHNCPVEEQQICVLGAESGATVHSREHLRIRFKSLHSGCEADVGFGFLHSQHSEC